MSDLEFPGLGCLRGEVRGIDAAPVQLGVLPKGAVVYDAMIAVLEEFNAGTNTVSVGTEGDPGVFLELTDPAGTQTMRGIGRAVGVDAPHGGTPIFATYTATGAAPTGGRAMVALLFIPSTYGWP